MAYLEYMLLSNGVYCNDADVSEYDSIASETWKRGGKEFMIESVVRSHCAVCGSSEITAHDVRRTVFSDRLFV